VILFCSVMTACAVAFEGREILLVNLITERRQQYAPRIWSRLLPLISGLRLFFVLPFLVTTVEEVIQTLGVDSISVCFNTVALLFLLEMDNVIFKVVLDDSTKVYHSEIGTHSPTKEEAKEMDFQKKFLLYWSVISISNFIITFKLLKDLRSRDSENDDHIDMSIVLLFYLVDYFRRIAIPVVYTFRYYEAKFQGQSSLTWTESLYLCRIASRNLFVCNIIEYGLRHVVDPRNYYIGADMDASDWLSFFLRYVFLPDLPYDYYYMVPKVPYIL